MNKLLSLFFITSIILLSACEATEVTPLPDFHLLKAKFQAEDVNWSNAAKTNNADYISNLYVEDAILGIPFQPFIKGKEAIATNWQRTVNAVDDLGFETQTLSGTEDIVYETGFAFTTYTINSVSIVDTSKYLIVWENDGDGNYKIVADLFNLIKPLNRTN